MADISREALPTPYCLQREKYTFLLKKVKEKFRDVLLTTPWLFWQITELSVGLVIEA